MNVIRIVALSILCALGLAPDARGQSARSWVGIELVEGIHGGVGIRSVLPGSPASRTDLSAGDEVLMVDAVSVHEPAELRRELGGKTPGSIVRLQIRGSAGIRITVVKPEARPSDLALIRHRLVGRPAPPFALARVGTGSTDPAVSLASHRGHPVLIDFWATWCGPCLHTLPELAELRQKHAKQSLAVLGISTEAQPTLRAAVSRLGIAHPVLVDADESVSRTYGISALPTLVLVDGEGIVRDVEIGGNIVALEAALDRLSHGAR